MRCGTRGWLQGFLVATVFTTWSSYFRFDSAAPTTGITADDVDLRRCALSKKNYRTCFAWWLPRGFNNKLLHRRGLVCPTRFITRCRPRLSPLGGWRSLVFRLGLPAFHC